VVDLTSNVLYPDACWLGGLSFVWSPRDHRLLYADDRNVYNYNTETSRRTRIFGGPAGAIDCNRVGVDHCFSNGIVGVSADARRLLVILIRHDQGGTNQAAVDLYLVNADGSGDQHLRAPSHSEKLTPIAASLP
jgi:hypothetical protein